MNAPLFTDAELSADVPLLELRDIEKSFFLRSALWDRLRRPRQRLAAVGGVSLAVSAGETIGVVGESGSGKSTLGKIIVRLIEPTAGTVIYRGVDVSARTGRSLLAYRRRVQMIFQDTHSSLNPRKRVSRMLAESLAARGVRADARPEEAIRLLHLVGLDPSIATRYPHELSGGQRQRVGIARSLGMTPELLVADEPVSALDVSLQGQIINLLTRLRVELGLTLIFISHDLAVVGRISTRVAVMYAGRIVEIGRPEDLMAAPVHPYTRALIDAVPKGLSGRAHRRKPLMGAPPAPGETIAGCPFRSRCLYAMPVCASRIPDTVSVSHDHHVDCHLAASGSFVGTAQQPPALAEVGEGDRLSASEAPPLAL
jgi:oligopeptide/dipeptide ABC transporter ATP-binding protein